MKKLINFLIALALLAGLGWVLWRGITHRPEAEHGEVKPEEKADAEKKDEHEDFVLKLEKEKWKALGIEMAEPMKAELKPQRVAFGRVLDPVPIVALDGELSSADAALIASRAEFDRTQALLKSGDGMSRKVAETAEAQFRGDEVKADGLRRRARLEWGAAFPAADAVKRRAFIERLVGGESALVRVELLPGDALAELPAAARISVLGREGQTMEANDIRAASDVDPKTQAQGFVLRVDRPPFALRPGMALTAWLELPQKVRAGFAVPRSAVLRHDGRAWVFVQEETEKFVRKAVNIETPLEGEKGWFVSEESGGIKADDLIVVTGAQTLLSEELKAHGGGEKE